MKKIRITRLLKALSFIMIGVAISFGANARDGDITLRAGTTYPRGENNGADNITINAIDINNTIDAVNDGETGLAATNTLAHNNANAISGKADKATTLSGYGITDAYTKTETDSAITTAISGKADKATTLSGYGIADAYTKTETDNKLFGKQDSLNTRQLEAVNSGITAEKVTALDGFDSRITSNTAALNTKQDKLTTNQLDAVNSGITAEKVAAISEKADKATSLSGYGITDAYTKTETDNKLFGKQDALSTSQLEAVNSGITASKVAALDGLDSRITSNTTALNNKQDKLTTDQQAAVDSGITAAKVAAISEKADRATSLSGYGITDAYTKTETNDKLSEKQDKLTTDQQAAVNSGITAAKVAAISEKADRATTLSGYGIADAYTKTETDSAITTVISGKADKATTLSGYGIADAYTKTETENKLSEKQDKLTTNQQAAVDSGITAEKVAAFDGFDSRITSNTTALNDKQDKLTTNQQAAVGSGITAEKVATLDGFDSRITDNTNAIGSQDYSSANYISSGQDLTSAISTLDANLGRVEDGLRSTKKEMKNGMASLAAMSALMPNARSHGSTQISIGTSNYRDSFGVAVGAFHYINDFTLLNAGVSYGGSDDFTVRAGITFGW